MDPNELEEFKQALVKLRRRLSDNIDQLSDEALKTAGEKSDELSDVPTEHLADRGSENFARDLKISILQTNDTNLCDVNLALEKIEQGTYGLCEECGEAIARRRLKALPFARLCITCREEEEKRGTETV